MTIQSLKKPNRILLIDNENEFKHEFARRLFAFIVYSHGLYKISIMRRTTIGLCCPIRSRVYRHALFELFVFLTVYYYFFFFDNRKTDGLHEFRKM